MWHASGICIRQRRSTATTEATMATLVFCDALTVTCPVCGMARRSPCRDTIQTIAARHAVEMVAEEGASGPTDQTMVSRACLPRAAARAIVADLRAAGIEADDAPDGDDASVAWVYATPATGGGWGGRPVMVRPHSDRARLARLITAGYTS